MRRRKLLALLGGSTTVGIAGCLGDDDPEEEPDDDPEDDDPDDDEPEDADEETDDPEDDEPEDAPAEFQVTDVTITPETLEQGEQIDEITAEIENVGDEVDDVDVEVHDADGDVIDTVDELTVGGRDAETVSFETIETPVQPGTYTYTVWTPDDEGQVTLSVEEIPAAVEVEAVSNEFEPAFVEIDVDERVLWIGAEGEHTVTFYHEDTGRQHRVPDGVDVFDEDLASGAITSLEFSEPGVYDYYCEPHEGQGMVGSVVVGSNDDPDQPGLSEPGEEIPADAADRLRQLNSQANDVLEIAQDVSVWLEDGSFEPEYAELDVGDNVIWEALDDAYHVALYHRDVEYVEEIEPEDEDDEPEVITEERQHRVPDAAEPFEDSLEEGESVSFTAIEAGIYDYYCQNNEGEGMVGTFVVGETVAPTPPGLAEPDETIPDVAVEELRALTERTIGERELVEFGPEVLEQANETIERLNTDEDGSIATVNEGLENVDDVEPIEPVEGETAEQARDEGNRLLDERERLTDEILTQVANEINAQAGFELVSEEDVQTPADARDEADDMPIEEAEQALRNAADFVEELQEGLDELANLLERTIELS